MEEILFRETTTLGIRRYPVSRHKLKRQADRGRRRRSARSRASSAGSRAGRRRSAPSTTTAPGSPPTTASPLREVYEAAHAAYRQAGRRHRPTVRAHRSTQPGQRRARALPVPRPHGATSHDPRPSQDGPRSHDGSGRRPILEARALAVSAGRRALVRWALVAIARSRCLGRSAGGSSTQLARRPASTAGSIESVEPPGSRSRARPDRGRRRGRRPGRRRRRRAAASTRPSRRAAGGPDLDRGPDLAAPGRDTPRPAADELAAGSAPIWDLADAGDAGRGDRPAAPASRSARSS